MNAVTIKQIFFAEGSISAFTFRWSLAGILVLVSCLLLIGNAHADGLFDFQMKLAKKGNAEAQFKVGEMYETGFGVKQDKAEAMKWISKAAKKGHETAGFKLLYWDIEKNGLTDANKEGFKELKAKAAAENHEAEYYLGKMHAQGIGVKKNPDKAMEWLNKAALAGVVAAEPEIVQIREAKQRQALAKRRADEKKQAQKKARKEREKQKQLEAKRKLEMQKQQEAKARAEAERKKQASAAAAAAIAEKEKQEQAAREKEKARLLAEQQAEERRLEAKRQAILKKREAERQKRKAKFESDPCSGKSARFLSTCR